MSGNNQPVLNFGNQNNHGTNANPQVLQAQVMHVTFVQPQPNLNSNISSQDMSNSSSTPHQGNDPREELLNEYLEIFPKPKLTEFFSEKEVPGSPHLHIKEKNGVISKKANCSNLNLTGKDFSDCNFEKSSFNNANMSSCTWTNVALFRTKLDKSDITGSATRGLSMSQLIQSKYSTLKARDKDTQDLIKEASKIKPFFDFWYLTQKYPGGFEQNRDKISEKDRAKFLSIVSNPEVLNAFKNGR